MNLYGLIAAIVQALASLGWPVAFVIAVWLFRDKLAELLPKLQVKHKDWEASFRLDQAEKEVPALPPVPDEAEVLQPTPEESSRFRELARLSPRAAMLEIRAELDAAVSRVAERYITQTASRPRSMANSIRILRKMDVIDQHTSAILDDLRVIGNSAAHGGDEFEVTESDAVRFRKLADQALIRLNAVP